MYIRLFLLFLFFRNMTCFLLLSYFYIHYITFQKKNQYEFLKWKMSIWKKNGENKRNLKFDKQNLKKLKKSVDKLEKEEYNSRVR